MRTQYIVKENDYKKRKEFYDYIINNYDLKICYPFVIDFKEKIFFISKA